MEQINYLYAQYEKSRPCASLFTSAKYGFEWSVDDGVIFYPSGYLSRSRAALLRCVIPSVPVCICDEEREEEEEEENVIMPELPTESLKNAVAKLPRALLVLAGDSEWVARTIPHLANRVPVDMLGRCITHRQLGDFLPYGDRKTRWWDVARKSSLPGNPKVKDKVIAAYQLFNEPLSKALFLAILRRYLFSSDAIIPYMEPNLQYFANVYIFLENEVFIDCGGFIGDTLEQYLRIKDRDTFEEYIIFEPDAKNYSILQNYIGSLGQDIRKKVTSYQCAVGQEKETLKFSGGEGSNSYIGPEGGEEVSCVTLDEALKDKMPTFLKMDLQGHEAFALYGAKNLIAEYHPVLAISVYHYVHDLWELPLLMQRFYPDYHYFLRAYRHEEEYICYAVPKERLRQQIAE